MKCFFCHLPMAGGQKALSHCIQTEEAVTYSPDSYSNGAVSSPKPTAHIKQAHSITADIQKFTELGTQQIAQADSALRWEVGTHDLKRSFLTSTIL